MRYLFLLPFLILATTCAFAQKKLRFQDAIYEEQVRTVMVNPVGSGNRDNLLPAAVPIQQQNLILEFDDIQETKNNYYARLIHCTFDWKKSSLQNLDFMKEYNEFPINDYQSSTNTHLPYFHYRFPLPTVKIPGNYLLMVYREGDQEDLIITRRVLVYDNRVNIAPVNQLGQGTLTGSNQQINFLVNYRDLPVINPLDNIHVVIRQNQRWDNARMDVKPSFLREDINQLEFRFFDQDKQWAAGNEFRFVDFRSLISPGQNTATINRRIKPFELYVQQDAPRTEAVYSQYRDLNGNYVIENLDLRENILTSQYLFVNFALRTSPLQNAKVYVVGGFNLWERNTENLMKYNSASGCYEASVLLKQGRFDYQYLVESADLPSYHFEGSHFQTENFYEVMVYFSSLQPRADLLIGYYLLPVNPR
ncbi:MAG: type IX secretion system plug protein domain-containing protein [Bacteroidota bacterium]